MKVFEIYKITNLVNNKTYIGITNQGYLVRYGHHLYEAKSGSTFKVHRAFNKYGKENMKVEVLTTCQSAEEAKEKEKEYIKEYKTRDDKFGYNMTDGGDGTFGRKHSEESRRKMSIVAKGRKPVDGINEKEVLQFTKDGLFIASYPSATKASKIFNCHVSTIPRAIKKGTPSQGYIWKYKEVITK